MKSGEDEYKRVTWQYAWGSLVDELTKYGQSSEGVTHLKEFMNVPYEARMTEDAGLRKALKEVISKIKEIFGISKKEEISKLLNRLQNEVVDLGTFRNVRNEIIHLRLTKGQVMKKYQELLDPTLEEIFTDKKSLGWTEEIMDAVKNGLSPKEEAFTNWQMEFYQEYYDTINPVYDEYYAINLPHNPYYSPTGRDLKSSVPEHILLLKEMHRYSAAMARSRKSKAESQLPLKFNDATEVLVNHIIQMEHFKAWTHCLRDLRSVFDDKKVRLAIEQYHGGNTLKQIDSCLKDMFKGGVDRALALTNRSSILINVFEQVE